MAKVLHGTEGIDQINVREDKTQVYGLKGNDTLINDNHSDVLLIGGSGNDNLIMTGGNGTLSGGEGKDTFEFIYSANQSISAVIEDFDPSGDSIVVHYAGRTKPQLSSVSGDNGDVVWSNGGTFNLTLKSVRENDYFDGEASDAVWDVLELTNAEREKENLPALTLSEGLMTAASTRADEIKNEYEEETTITHRRYPYRQLHNDDYTDYETVFDDKYHSFGENLEGGSRTAEEVMEYWMNHDEHKENILRENYPTEKGVDNFKKLGVGYKHLPEAPLEAYQDYWVQEFADSLKTQETVDVSNVNIETVPVSLSVSIADINGSNDKTGVTISGTARADTITNSGLIVSISSGEGNDSIDNSGSFVTINAGKGNDSISLSADTKENLIEYTPGDGADIITGFNANSTLKIAGNDKYTPATVRNDLIVAVGNDSITLEGAANSGGHIIGNRSKLFIGTENADNLKNTDDNTTIQALGGNDYISNTGENVLFSYDSGNDTISGFNDTSSLQVAEGSYSSVIIDKDLILIGSAVTESIKILGASNLSSINIFDANNNPVTLKNAQNVSLTEGNDTYRNIIDYATIQALGGEDTIENIGTRVSIFSGDGNDSVYSSGNNVTIISGTGNDSITNEGAKVSILSGDGDDSINNTGDRVSIYAGAGNDQIDNNQRHGTIYIYEGGNDTIEGFNESDTLNIGGYAYNTVPSDNDIIVNIISNAKIIGSITLKDYPDDQINIDSTFSAPGLDISNPTSSTVVIGTTGDDSIYNIGSNVTIDASLGNDSIENGDITSSIFGANVLINGAAGKDSIENWGNSVTINGGSDNDSIKDSGEAVLIDGGAGNDYIDNSFGNFVTINGGAGDDSIYNHGDSAIVNGEDDDDYIWNNGSTVTINGGEGDDNVYIDSIASHVTINVDTGNDTIENRASNVTIEADTGNDSIKNYGDSVIIDAGDGNDSIDHEYGSNVIIYGGTGNDSIESNSNSATVDGGDGGDFIYNGNGANNVSINGGRGDDTIENTGDFITIIGGTGNDSIYNWFVADSVTITSGKGDDTVFIDGGKNVSIHTGAGDDSIKSDGDFVTIDGGTDDDKISLSSYAKNNIIEYRRGEGNDTIWGYDDNDSIRIFDNPGISKWDSVKRGQDVIIKVGDKEIIVKDGVGKKIHTIVGESGTAGGLSDGGNSGGGSSSGTSSGRGGNGSSRGNDTSGGTSSDADNNANAVAGATSSIGKGDENFGDRGGNYISRQNKYATTINNPATPTENPADYSTPITSSIQTANSSPTATTSTSELHSYQDNAAALQVETQSAQPEKLSLTFPSNWNFPSFNQIKMPSLIITGTPEADELHAGDEGYQLWGLESNDTLIGGAGDDVFVGGKNQGSDTFLNVSARDIVYLNDVTLSDLSRINKDGDMVTFAFKNGNSVTIQSSDTVSGAVVLGDLTLHFTHPPKA